MKKTILVSAERGETRVAVLESKTKGGKADVAELYIERRGRRSIVGNIYKGKVDNVLPGMEAAFVDIGLERNGFLHVDEIVLPGRRAGAQARPRLRPPDQRADQTRPGDPRPGGQGPAEDEGRAALDERLDRRPLPGLRAAGQRRRRQPPPHRLRARPAAQDGRPHLQGPGRADRPHRRPRRQKIRLRARDRLPAATQRGARAAQRDDQGAGARLPGGRPLGAGPARRLPQRVREGDHRLREAVRAGHQLLPAHRAGAGRRRRALQEARSRCSRNGRSTRRSSRP